MTLYESAGRGHPVVLVHGNSASGLTFSKQINGGLGQTHRVLALDLPGHGKSDRPRDPKSTYSLPGFAGVVTGVVEALDVPDAVLVGWSLGGHAVMEAAPLLSEAAGFVIYGAPPLGKPPAMDRAFGVHPGMDAMFAASADPELVQSLISGYFTHESSTAIDELVNMWNQTDGNARALLGQSFGAGVYTDEVQIVGELTQPIAILQGGNDALVRPEYLESLEIPTLWRGAVQIVPDATHAPHLESPGAFDRLVAAFVDEVLG